MHTIMVNIFKPGFRRMCQNYFNSFFTKRANFLKWNSKETSFFWSSNLNSVFEYVAHFDTSFAFGRVFNWKNHKTRLTSHQSKIKPFVWFYLQKKMKQKKSNRQTKYAFTEITEKLIWNNLLSPKKNTHSIAMAMYYLDFIDILVKKIAIYTIYSTHILV